MLHCKIYANDSVMLSIAIKCVSSSIIWEGRNAKELSIHICKYKAK